MRQKYCGERRQFRGSQVRSHFIVTRNEGIGVEK
jgi:hypothetical protein